MTSAGGCRSPTPPSGRPPDIGRGGLPLELARSRGLDPEAAALVTGSGAVGSGRAGRPPGVGSGRPSGRLPARPPAPPGRRSSSPPGARVRSSAWPPPGSPMTGRASGCWWTRLRRQGIGSPSAGRRRGAGHRCRLGLAGAGGDGTGRTFTGPAAGGRLALGPGYSKRDRGVAVELLQLMVGVDAPHGARLGPHDERLGGRPLAVEVHAPQQLAVGDPGGGEEAVVAPDQVVGGQHRVEVVAGPDARPSARRRCGATAGPATRRPCT